MTPARARDLLSESPSVETVCERCATLTFCYVEPDNLWTHDTGATVCRPCLARIATGRATPAPTVELGL